VSTTSTHVEEVLECVQSCVTQEMNECLTKSFTGGEVWEALQDMGDLKALGADGIPVVFYKKFWNLVGEKVKREVLEVLNGAMMPQG
jgi:hypothetical protein